MRSNNRLIGILTAIIVGTLIAVSVQAVSQPNTEQDVSVFGHQVEATVLAELTEADITPAIVFEPETPVPTAAPMELRVVGTPVPTPPPPPNLAAIPTAAPISPAPQPATLATTANIIWHTDFATNDTNNDMATWHVGHIYPEPEPAPAWVLRDDTATHDSVLMAPADDNAINVMSDMFAVAPSSRVSLAGDGSIEVSALSRMAPTMGIVARYTDDNNYVALIIGTNDAHGRGGAGVSLVVVQDGTPLTVAKNTNHTIEYDQWYQLRFVQTGNTLQAFVDGELAAETTVAAPLGGSQVGLYAGNEGFVFFDNLLVTGEK